MFSRNKWLAAAVLIAVGAQTVQAEAIRFRYVPMDACGTMALATGERAAWIGGVYTPYANRPRPTHMVTFRHPFTGRNVNVPMIFPAGAPRIENWRDRIVYNYTNYQITALFLSDGSVQTIYNSGALRPVAF